MRALILPSLLIATASIFSCGANGDNAPFAPPADEEEQPTPADATIDDSGGDGQLPGPADQGGGFPNSPSSDPDSQLGGVLSPFGASSPFEGSLLELGSFPLDRIVSGGVGKDGIPALTKPDFVKASRVEYLAEDDLVLGVVVNGEAKAYPENIGWWHEIVNDEIGGRHVSVTFCPLTGTGLVFEANDGGPFELGVSGLLFNNNLVMYDRRDDETLYPQVYFTGVSGTRTGESLNLLPVVETTWSTWKRLHPETEVIAVGTYTQSQYARYPYGDYRTNDNFLIFGLFPVMLDNANLMATAHGGKDGLLGVRLNGQPMAYLFDAMGNQAVINDRVGGEDIVVVWDQASHLAIPYASQVNGSTLNFEIEHDGFPFSLRDVETGSLWDINGVAIDGQMTGARLTQIPAHNSFWFAWVTFWQQTDVWSPTGG